MSIEDLEKIKKKYDFFFCMGVIHHMKDPRVSFKKISSIMKKNSEGIFFLYGKYGRFDITRVRKMLDLLGKNVDDKDSFNFANSLIEEISMNKTIFKIKRILRILKNKSYRKHYDLATYDNYLVPIEHTYNYKNILKLLHGTDFKFSQFVNDVPGSINMNKKYQSDIETSYQRLDYNSKIYFNEMMQKPSNYTFIVKKN